MQEINKKNNIAFVLMSLSDTGGSELVVYNLIKSIDKNKYNIHVVSPVMGPLFEKYKNLNVKIHILDEGLKINFRSILSLRKIIIREKIKIISPHHFLPLFHSFLAILFLKTKLVYTEHSKWQIEEYGRIYSIVNSIIMRRSNAIIAISNQIYDFLIKELKIDDKKVFFIKNGINYDSFDYKRIGSVRQKFGFNNNDIIVGTVSNLRPEKNHKLLIESFCSIMDKNKKLKLVIVGVDKMDGEVHRFANTFAHNGRIVFLGKQDNIPEILSMFDVFCLTSKYEGLPLSILEAMASGVPVIGTNVLGINEIVKNNINGFLIEYDDIVGLSLLILKLIENNVIKERIIEKAKKLVKKEYNLNNSARLYEKLYDKLLKQEN